MSGGKDESGMNEHYDLVQTVQLTEKASLLSEKLNKYVFRVSPRANKIQIKQAIERLFNKKVVAVNTCNYAGKKKRERRADFGRKAHWKKAIVTLKEGEKIDLV
jgi:large subunit ribosomal protein L23